MILNQPRYNFAYIFSLTLQLLENVYEDSENVRIAYLKAYEQEPLSHIYYQDTIQGEIAGDEVITQADVTETKGRIKTKGYRKTLYKLSRHAFTKVKALAKNFIGKKNNLYWMYL